MSALRSNPNEAADILPIWKILVQAITLYRKQFSLFFLLALVPGSYRLVFNLLPSFDRIPYFTSILIGTLEVAIVVLGLWAAAAISFAGEAATRGVTIPPRKAVATGWRLLPQVALPALWFGLIVGGLVAGGFLIIIFLSFPKSFFFLPLAGITGFILRGILFVVATLVLQGLALYFCLRFLLWLPAAALGGHRNFRALTHSGSLLAVPVRATRWLRSSLDCAFVLLFVFFLVSRIGDLPIWLALAGNETFARAKYHPTVAMAAAETLLSTLLFPFYVLALTVFYLDLRTRAEPKIEPASGSSSRSACWWVLSCCPWLSRAASQEPRAFSPYRTSPPCSWGSS